MVENGLPASPETRLTKSGVTRLVVVLSTVIVSAAIYFFAAGTVDLPCGWLYYLGLLIYLAAAIVVIFVCFPEAIEAVNARGKTKKDVKAWDKVFGIVHSSMLLMSPAVAG